MPGGTAWHCVDRQLGCVPTASDPAGRERQISALIKVSAHFCNIHRMTGHRNRLGQEGAVGISGCNNGKFRFSKVAYGGRSVHANAHFVRSSWDGDRQNVRTHCRGHCECLGPRRAVRYPNVHFTKKRSHRHRHIAVSGGVDDRENKVSVVRIFSVNSPNCRVTVHESDWIWQPVVGVRY